MLAMPADTFPFFFFNDTATTEIYTLSLHDALPISSRRARPGSRQPRATDAEGAQRMAIASPLAGARSPGFRRRHRSRASRSEEHTSELQSQSNLVCRLLLEKKKVCGTRSSALRRPS